MSPLSHHSKFKTKGERCIYDGSEKDLDHDLSINEMKKITNFWKDYIYIYLPLSLALSCKDKAYFTIMAVSESNACFK